MPADGKSIKIRQPQRRTQVLETYSALFGVIGTLMLAIKSKYAGAAFVFYLFSNIGWITFAAANHHWGLLAQNLIFLATSLIGIWSWIVRPWLADRKKKRMAFVLQEY